MEVVLLYNLTKQIFYSQEFRYATKIMKAEERLHLNPVQHNETT